MTESDVGLSLSNIAAQMEQRERDLGQPAGDGPTADEVWSTVAAIELLDGAADVTPTQLWETIQLLAETCDKWLVPEEDPIGTVARPAFEEVIFRLEHLLNKFVPGAKDEIEKHENTRALAYHAKRSAFLRARNPNLFQKLGIDFEPSVFFRTLFATALYRTGKALSALGKMLSKL
jgi:hypothetical protein